MAFRIAVIPGDGIGKEVMPEGIKALNAISDKHGVTFEFQSFEFSSCEYYLKHGKMLPDDWKEILSSFGAIYFGAVGWPEAVPDHISLWGSLLKFRREFDQYVCLRPVRLMPGVVSPLAGRKVGDIDFYVVRENSEGEYSSVGGVMYEGTTHETVLQESIFTKRGVNRILSYAYELAIKREKKMSLLLPNQTVFITQCHSGIAVWRSLLNSILKSLLINIILIFLRHNL